MTLQTGTPPHLLVSRSEHSVTVDKHLHREFFGSIEYRRIAEMARTLSGLFGPGASIRKGEAKGGTNYWLYTAKGERLSDQSLGELSPKAIYWLDGTNKVFIVGNTIYKWPREKVGEVEGRIVAIADCIGDWREEVITALDGEIRIYSTTVPATSRCVCLMQDRLYRTDVAMQTMGYFYPPRLGGTPLRTEK